MKIAVIILAHKNPSQTLRLIESLKHPNFDFFIHFDKKMKINEQEMLKFAKWGGGAQQLVDCKLDHWSLPYAVLKTIKLAKGKEKPEDPYRYYILLSGQDYPIKPTEYIYQILKQNYPAPFIDVDKYDDNPWVRSKFKLVRWAHKIDKIHQKMSSGIFRKIVVAPLVIAEWVERNFYGTPLERLSRLGVKPYGGSQWWILSDMIITEILDDIEHNPKIIREYSRTWTPEETFFQTMSMRTSFQDSIEIIPQQIKQFQNCLTYANFRTPDKSFCGHPHVITMKEIDYILNGKQLFARKFDEDIDREVLHYIDSWRLNPENCNKKYEYFITSNGKWD